MAAKVRSLDELLPATLYWDASFIVNFAFEVARYFRQWSELLARLDKAATISYVSTLCERFLGSLRRECLDRFVILNERPGHRLAKEYKAYFNHARLMRASSDAYRVAHRDRTHHPSWQRFHRGRCSTACITTTPGWW